MSAIVDRKRGRAERESVAFGKLSRVQPPDASHATELPRAPGGIRLSFFFFPHLPSLLSDVEKRRLAAMQNGKRIALNPKKFPPRTHAHDDRGAAEHAQ